MWSTLLYGCETWTITTRHMTKLHSFEMWAYLKMMKISWREKKTNEEVLTLADEQLYIIPTIKKRKITNFGHRRTGEHPFGGSNRVLPEWRTQLVCHAAPPGRKNNNELLQCLFLTVVDYIRWTSPLLPHPKCISGRWILVPFGVTQLVKQMCCLLPE